MKNLKILIIILIFLAGFSVSAQYNAKAEFTNIQLSYSKTTSILFPYAIKSLDIGSRDVLVQKAKGVENILLIKAGQLNFLQTNLTVVTSDGRLYLFVLNYDDKCPDLNVKAENAVVSNNDILFSIESENQKKIEQCASLVFFKKKKFSGLKKSKLQIKLEVNGIFVHQDVFYLRVVLENNSKINYDIDQFRFFIRDKRKSKRTASQELEIEPIYKTSSSTLVPYESEVTKVYAIEKFTIPDNKYLTLQLLEKRGGRHIEIDVNNNNLIYKVFPISEFTTDNF